MKLLKYTLCAAILSSTLTATSCSLFSVYKIDVPQGTPVSQTQAQKVQLGMDKSQVIYLLGSPAFTDTLAPNRWDYIYDYTPGTYGVREGRASINDAEQHLVIYFDSLNKVSRIDGVDTLPATRQTFTKEDTNKSKWYWPF